MKIKKMILTIGSTASVITPLATISCNSEEPVDALSNYAVVENIGGTLHINNINMPTSTDAPDYYGWMAVAASIEANNDASQLHIKIEKDVSGRPKRPVLLRVEDIVFAYGSTYTTIGELLTAYSENEDPIHTKATAMQEIIEEANNIAQIPPVDSTGMVDKLLSLSITSTLTLSEALLITDEISDASDFTGKYHLNILPSEINDILGSDWKITKTSNICKGEGLELWFAHIDTPNINHEVVLMVSWAE